MRCWSWQSGQVGGGRRASGRSGRRGWGLDTERAAEICQREGENWSSKHIRKTLTLDVDLAPVPSLKRGLLGLEGDTVVLLDKVEDALVVLRVDERGGGCVSADGVFVKNRLEHEQFEASGAICVRFGRHDSFLDNQTCSDGHKFSRGLQTGRRRVMPAVILAVICLNKRSCDGSRPERPGTPVERYKLSLRRAFCNEEYSRSPQRATDPTSARLGSERPLTSR